MIILSSATATLRRAAVSRSSSCRGKCVRWASTETATPLFLWVGDQDANVPADTKQQLLLPITPPIDPTLTISSDMMKDLVNQHYESDAHFVGGMGESDPGVWLAALPGSTKDTLDCAADFLQAGIESVKEERHGVPFGVYTTGILSSPSSLDVPLSELGLSCIQVSLFAGSPDKFKAATGKEAAQFGQVCGFIADAAEQGIAVEVGVLESDVGPASDLAHSLGAQHIHVYKDTTEI